MPGTISMPTDDTLIHSLLQAMPPNARRVLELSPRDGALGVHYRTLWPGVQWDRLASLPAAAPAERYDWVVVDARADLWRQGCAGLEALHDWVTPQAQLLCGLPNVGHHEVLQRLAMGDSTGDDGGVRMFTPASAYKQLLDAGWLPHMPAQCRTEVPESVFSARLIGAAMALGVPRQTVQRNLGLRHMVISCRRMALSAPTADSRYAPFSVIVPVNRPLELALNIERSPGLKEVNAEIVTVEGARSAADAFEQGAQRAGAAWRVFVHQDVYFPVGSGLMLAQRLGALEADGRCGAPVGFAGLEAGPDLRTGLRYAGQVIDRTQHFDHAASSAGVSIDEFAIALHRDSPLAPDPALGWHLWATDLCLQAYALGGAPCAEILRVPLFHNSTTGYTLPAEFHDSAAVLLDKYSVFDEIPTLCGALQRQARAAA